MSKSLVSIETLKVTLQEVLSLIAEKRGNWQDDQLEKLDSRFRGNDGLLREAASTRGGTMPFKTIAQQVPGATRLDRHRDMETQRKSLFLV